MSEAEQTPSPMGVGPQPNGTTYDASAIQVLEGLEAVRKRPGMYIGSTGPRGLHHLVTEIVDNSVDEALAGYADTIDVTLLADGAVRVVDNGRGIPTDIGPGQSVSAVELVLTQLHAGGKFGGGGYKVSGGLHGVGSSVVNALSTRLDIEVRQKGYRYSMVFDIGVPRGPLSRGRALENPDQTGTTVIFWANATIFETTDYDFETLRARFQQMAFLNKGLTITLTDEREQVSEGSEDIDLDQADAEVAVETVDASDSSGSTETSTADAPKRKAKKVSYRYDGGLVDYVKHLVTSKRSEAINEDRFKDQVPLMKDQVMEAIESIEKLYERRGAITGLASGFKNFDQMTNGLHPSEMVVIAARPSMGKTVFAMNIAEHVAVNIKQPVAIFSLEMSSQQLVQRLLCSRARVNLGKVRDGFLSERDFPNLMTAAAKLAESQIYIDDTAGLSILELRSKARRFKQMHDIKLIVIDYLQLLRSTSRRAQDNRQLEIAEISSGVKALAKELNIPIIVLAQLNRNPEARKGGRPVLSDLRESGSIEQDADLVGLLIRSEYYAEDEEQREETKGEAELIIAKQRNGPVGDVKLTFLKEFTRFEDRADAPHQG